MKKLWTGFLASALIAVFLFSILDATYLAYKLLNFVRTQILEPPAAPSGLIPQKVDPEGHKIHYNEVLGVRNDTPLTLTNWACVRDDNKDIVTQGQTAFPQDLRCFTGTKPYDTDTGYRILTKQFGLLTQTTMGVAPEGLLKAGGTVKGKPDQWRKILVDEKGRVIISPLSFMPALARTEGGVTILYPAGGIGGEGNYNILQVDKDGRVLCSPNIKDPIAATVEWLDRCEGPHVLGGPYCIREDGAIVVEALIAKEEKQGKP